MLTQYRIKENELDLDSENPFYQNGKCDLIKDYCDAVDCSNCNVCCEMQDDLV
jgi:hypothetical protein